MADIEFVLPIVLYEELIRMASARLENNRETVSLNDPTKGETELFSNTMVSKHELLFQPRQIGEGGSLLKLQVAQTDMF